jgi:hypothetical protein
VPLTVQIVEDNNKSTVIRLIKVLEQNQLHLPFNMTQVSAKSRSHSPELLGSTQEMFGKAMDPISLSDEGRQQRPRSNVDQNHLGISHRSGSVGYQANDSNHYSPNSYADVQRHKPQEIDYHQKIKCPLGIQCRNYENAHRSKYSHSLK